MDLFDCVVLSYKLIECLYFFIEFVFKNKNRKYLSVTNSGAHFVASKRSCGRVYGINGVKTHWNFFSKFWRASIATFTISKVHEKNDKQILS